MEVVQEDPEEDEGDTESYAGQAPAEDMYIAEEQEDDWSSTSTLSMLFELDHLELLSLRMPLALSLSAPSWTLVPSPTTSLLIRPDSLMPRSSLLKGARSLAPAARPLQHSPVSR